MREVKVGKPDSLSDAPIHYWVEFSPHHGATYLMAQVGTEKAYLLVLYSNQVRKVYDDKIGVIGLPMTPHNALKTFGED